MNADEVEEFRKMMAQLDAFYQEMAALVKQGADKPVNVFKVKLANSILARADHVLGDNKPSLGFELFDEEALPTASDINFVVRQYVECAENIRQANIEKYHNNVWYWKTGHIATTPPKVNK